LSIYDRNAPQEPWYKRVSWTAVGIILAVLIALGYFMDVPQMVRDMQNGKPAADVAAEE